ncbi:hypothetical protein RI367_003927 [Sorochytrium milnesiophthora]
MFHLDTHSHSQNHPGHLDAQTRVSKKLDDLYKLIDGISVAMMVTRREDGHMVSRAMKVQKRIKGVDLCFITNNQTHKLDELLYDPNVCLTFYKDKTGEWVSVSGLAKISRDRDLISEVWTDDLKTWFPNISESDPSSDPRVGLVVVNTVSVTYSVVESSPKVLYDLAVSGLTNSAVPTTDNKVRELTEQDVNAARVLESNTANGQQSSAASLRKQQ